MRLLRFAQAALVGLLSTALPSIGADRALLIGISDYPTSPLRGPVNDVLRMQEALTSNLGFAAQNVMILPQAQATNAGIKSAFEEWLVAGTGPGDRVFIYYSGHGTQVADQDNDEPGDGMDEALVMIDFGSDNPAGVLTDDEISALLADLAGRKVTMVVDACHSGSVQRSLSGGGPVDPAARFLPPPLGVVPSQGASRSALLSDGGLARDIGGFAEIWTAASSYQLAWEARIGGTALGVFTDAFTRGLADPAADANGNGLLSRSELFDYVGDRTEAFCQASGPCSNEGKGFTPTLYAPFAVRGLTVAAWPADTSEEVPEPSDPPSNPTQPPAHGLSTDAMLDILTGGGVPAELRLRHADQRKAGPVRAGDRVAFEILSPAGGQVILLDLRDDGLVHQLFPSRIMGKNTPAAPNRALVIPDAFSGTEFRLPPGRGALVAIVASEPRLIDRLAAQNTQMAPIPDPVTFLNGLMAELTAPWQEHGENRRARFGIAHLRYDAR